MRWLKDDALQQNILKDLAVLVNDGKLLVNQQRAVASKHNVTLGHLNRN